MKLILKILVFLACGTKALCQYRCPSGWALSYGNRCFRVEEQAGINWYDAKIACEDLGGSLVIFDTQDVNNFISSNLVSGMHWVGLHDMGSEGTFIWINMVLVETYGYSNWASGQPDNWGAGEDCVYVGGNGQWQDVACGSAQVSKYICQTAMDVPIRCDEDDGWASVNDMCYKMYTSPKTWQSARDYCQGVGGELVTVENTVVQDYLTQLTDDRTVWIGLSDITSGIPGEYTYVKGDSLIYMNWAPLQPSNSYSPNCVEIKQTDNGGWSCNSCTTTNSFVCGKPEGSCAPGWHIYGGQCYQLNTYFPASWTDAKHTCDVQGAHLVTINNAAENDNLVSKFELLQSAGINNIWIGISDTVIDGSFRWADGTSTVPYTKWGLNQPVNNADQPDCGAMDTTVSTGEWKTSNCFLIQAFVCEIQVGQTVVPVPPGYEIGRCQENWALHGDYCYLFETGVQQNFNNAQTACQTNGGQLASITTADEQSFINSRLDNNQQRMVVGLRDAVGDGTFRWSDGSVVSFTNWFPGKPGNPSGSAVCAILEYEESRLGTWNTYDCNSIYGYVCKQRKGSGGIVTDFPRPTAVFNDKCGSGFEYNAATSSCYKIVIDEAVDWLTAETNCRKTGGHLLSLRNTNEQHFITGRLYGVNAPVLWIGANDRTEEGGWRWSDSTPFAYLNWALGQPDDYYDGQLGADCVQIVPNTGQWYDHKCDQEIGYICENNGILVDYFIVVHDSALDGYIFLQLQDVYPDDCAQRCLDEIQCKSFNYDKDNLACALNRENRSADSLSTYPGDPYDYYEISSYPKQPVSTTLAPGSRCDSGWYSFRSSCYSLLYQKLQWIDARDVCRREGGDLTSVADMTENAFVTYMVQSACEGWHSDLTTTEYNYTYVPGPLKNERVVFEVKANSDVHIALSEFNYYVFNQYEIVIGGWSNTQSVIRRCLTCPHEVQVATPSILSGTEYRAFWITFADGKITVGEEGGSAFMSWTDPNPITINYVGYSTGYGHDGSFRLCTKHTESGRVWIGLHDPLGQDHYEWSDRSMVTLTNWKNGEPNNYNGLQEFCVNAWTDGYRAGYWNDGPCDNLLRAVCKKPKQVLPPTTVPVPTGCDTDWYSFDTSCYKFETTAMRGWTASQRDCQSWGGHLVSINNNVEQAFLSSKLMQVTDSTSFWTGLNDLNDYGTYIWEDGQRVTYTNWAVGQPDTRSGDCVALSTGAQTGGLWSVMVCNTVQPFVCEKLKIGFTLPPPYVATTHSSLGCSDGWVGYNENCFLLVTKDSEETRKTWNDALTDCRARGGDLASFHSAAEEQYLVVNSGINDWANGYWIGLNENEDGGYVWSDGSPVNYIDWNDGQPNGGPNANCVMMFFHATKNWDDQLCDKPKNWLCKIHKGVSPVSQVPIPTATRSTACGGDLEWYYYGGKCYYVTNTESESRMSWQNARNFCNLNAAVLASIHAQDEQELILSQVDMRGTWAAWIGLREYQASSVYQWSDGTDLDYTYWSPNEPNDANGEEQCVEMRAHDGMWNDNNCGDRLSFVCKKDVGSTNPITQAPTQGLPPGSNCPTGFIEHNNICYVFNGYDVNDWYTARDKCRDAGGDLATIHSQEQQAYMTSQLRGFQSAMWIGFSDNNWEGQFRWTDGSAVNFANWATGEPNGGRDENCAEMHFRGYGGYWNDVSCDNSAGYICQAYKSPNNPPPQVTQSYCKPGYQQYWNGCYKVFTVAYTYSQARSYCQQDSAELVSILDIYENAFVEYHMLLAGKPFWIGLNDIESSGRYKWTDGTPVLFTSWGDDEPSKDVNEGCVRMTTEGSWDDTNCQSPMAGMCKYWTGVQPTTPPPGEGTCLTNSSWIAYGGFCYHFSKSSERRSWPEAQYECRNLGGSIVTIGSDAENSYLQTILKENNLNIWLGLKRNEQGGFTWTDGKPVSYTRWAPGEPNGLDSGEDCGEMYFSSGEWNDVDCYWELGFVCKMQQIIGAPEPIPSEDGSDSISIGAVVGIIIAIVVVAVIAGVVIFCVRSKGTSGGISLPSLTKKSNPYDMSVGFSPSLGPQVGIDDKVKFEMNVADA